MKNNGFTLIEVLIVVVIVGILSMIAIRLLNPTPEARMIACCEDLKACETLVEQAAEQTFPRTPTWQEVQGIAGNRWKDHYHYVPNNSDGNAGHGNDLDLCDEENPAHPPRIGTAWTSDSSSSATITTVNWQTTTQYWTASVLWCSRWQPSTARSPRRARSRRCSRPGTVMSSFVASFTGVSQIRTSPSGSTCEQVRRRNSLVFPAKLSEIPGVAREEAPPTQLSRHPEFAHCPS